MIHDGNDGSLHSSYVNPRESTYRRPVIAVMPRRSEALCSQTVILNGERTRCAGEDKSCLGEEDQTWL